jgi:site-specific recombinase XerC
MSPKRRRTGVSSPPEDTALREGTRIQPFSRAGTLRWCIDNFLLDARARDLSEDTLDFYNRKLRPLVRFLVNDGLTQAGALTPRHLSRYLVSLRDTGMTPANIHTHARALRAFLHWLTDNELINPIISRQFKMPRAPVPTRDGFSTGQVDELLDAARRTPTPERDTAILLLMADVGLRAGEIGRILDADCELDRIHVEGKGRRERYVPLAPQTRKAITRWRRRRGDSEYLFITVRGDPFDRQTVYKLFRRLGSVTGISPCHPHMMRRTTAVEWIRAGGDTFSLQGLLGHSSQTMTKVYVELADEDVAIKHRRLSLAERLKGKKGR